MKQRRNGVVSAAAASLLVLTATVAAAVTEPQRLVNDATATVESFLADSELRAVQSYLHQSSGVLIVPGLVKAGVGIGGEGGSGVLLRRDPATGEWSHPAFVHLRGATLGPQLGVEDTEAIFVIMNDETLNALLSDQVKLGADMSAVIGSREARREGATALERRSDIRAFARSGGLYAGASVKGTVVSAKDDWNTAYYGRPVTAEEILTDPSVTNNEAAPLLETLSRL